MKKKILAVFLSLCMAMSLLPVTVLAAEDGTAVTDNTTELRSGKYYVSNDITLNHSLTIPADETVTLDLRGQTLTLQQLLVNGSLTIYDSQSKGQITSTITDQKTGAIKVGTAGLLTLQSGTISSPGYGVYVSDGGKTIVNGGMITSTYAPLAGNNTAGDMNFEVNDGTLTASNGPAIYMPGQVSLKITGGTLNGGISLRMGQVDISGGTINAITDNIDSITEFYDFSGNAWLADALYVFNGTYTSGNTTYGNSLNLNITGGTFNCKNDQGSAVAIYDLGKVDQNSQVNISGDAVLNSSVDGRGAYQVLSLADVGVIEPAAGYGKEEYVGKVSTTITGGTFSSKPDADYIATGYAATKNDAGKYVVGLKDDGALEVKPSTDSGKTSATLEGIYAGEGTVVEKPENGTGSGTPNKAGTDVTVDLTTKGEEPAETTGTVELTVNADTAQSLVSANAEALTVKSDVGTVSLDKDALGELKDVSEPVVISIAATNDEGAAPTWEVTVKEGEKELFAETTDVGITITVPYTAEGASSENTKVYCIDNGMEDMNAKLEGDNLTWTTSHLSTFAAVTLGANDTITYTTADGVDSTSDLAIALSSVKYGGTITLLKDIPNAKGIAVPSEKNFTIDFGGHTYTLSGPGAGSTNTETNGFQLLKDSTITFKNGTIRIAEGATLIKRIIQNYADLTLENMQIYAENQVDGENYPLSFNNGNIVFKGNTSIYTTENTTNAFDVCKYADYPSTIVTFDESYTGRINGNIVYDSDNADSHKLIINGNGTFGGIKLSSAVQNITPSITISGGSFKESVAQYVTSDLKYEANANGTYTYHGTLDAALAVSDTVSSVEAAKDDANAVTVTVKNGNDVDTIKLTSGTEYSLPDYPDQGYNHFQGWTDQAGNRYNGGQTVKIEKDTTFTAVWSYIPPANPNYRIDIPAAEGGTVTANPAAAKAGATVTLTATPDEGYAVGTITVTDRFGDAVKVTENADGTYTFTMPNGQVTVKATFVETEEPAPAMPFTDVKEGDWFYEEVLYAYENGLMNGVGDNRFAPNSATTRGMLVTILYRLEGEPAVTGEAGFDDVGDTWYTDAVIWAAANDIVNGIGDNQFGPENTLTREQLVTMLYRYAQNKGYDVTASADLSGYPDAGQIQSWAQDAMTWAVAEGIVEGMDGNLNPAGHATRAQIATILMRFCEGVAK